MKTYTYISKDFKKICIDKIDGILKNPYLTTKQKREFLNKLEKDNPQHLFIKTHLCNKCQSLMVEVWFKDISYEE